MSVEYIVQNRVKELKDRQERLIEQNKLSCSTGFFIGFLNSKNHSDTRRENEIFRDGYAKGLEEGLRNPITTDKLANGTNTYKHRRRDFYAEFSKLVEKYQCRFTYDPQQGMIIEDLL